MGRSCVWERYKWAWSCVWKRYKQWGFFQNLIILFLDILTQQISSLIIKISFFWGDLSGISAKTATLDTNGLILRLGKIQIGWSRVWERYKWADLAFGRDANGPILRLSIVSWRSCSGVLCTVHMSRNRHQQEKNYKKTNIRREQLWEQEILVKQRWQQVRRTHSARHVSSNLDTHEKEAFISQSKMLHCVAPNSKSVAQH